MLKVENIFKRYNTKTISGIEGLSFSLETGKVYSLLGPSGCGKSTTLKIIHGDVQADRGEVKKDNLKISMLTGDDALNMEISLLENLKQTALATLDVTDEKAINLSREALMMLEITNEIHKLPSEISTGQYQRALLAKALIQRPNLLLLDEPFTNIDPYIRKQIIEDLLEIASRDEMTILWVTHHMSDALSYSDQTMVMNMGKIVQTSRPEEIIWKPQNYFVAEFFSPNNILVGNLLNKEKIELDLKFAKIEVSAKNLNFDLSEEVIENVLVSIRPSSISISEDGDIKGKVSRSLFKGEFFQTYVDIKGTELVCFTQQSFQADQKVQLTIDSSKIWVNKEV
jgi:ABC-type Fe3+/spermidine/putrescine transport system ATPase subunit